MRFVASLFFLHPRVGVLVENGLEGIFFARLSKVVDKTIDGVESRVKRAVDPLRLEGKSITREINS